jgi:hypothetical protein
MTTVILLTCVYLRGPDLSLKTTPLTDRQVSAIVADRESDEPARTDKQICRAKFGKTPAMAYVEGV